ncbi:MAG TPA: ZIP family metal transporter [Anaerovoracaceae bacterium]|nr:ZIP family metal transporter [Anaerovoracaceae bacterium]
MTLQIFGGLMIPLIGTTLGSFMVIFMKETFNRKLEKFLLGFASGVMIAASIWSLIMPAVDMAAEQGVIEWLPAAVGFLLGIFFLLLLDRIIPHLHANESEPEGPEANLSNNTMLFLAVTLHNIPEGMAVGVVFAGVIANSSLMTLSGAMVLAIGIAIQNFPEGAIISMPLNSRGVSKKRAFNLGFLSGAVEPISAIITLLITGLITGVLPYLLSFAAGAMIYVVVEELVPEGQDGKHSDYSTIGVAIGFVIMMILDIALG